MFADVLPNLSQQAYYLIFLNQSAIVVKIPICLICSSLCCDGPREK